MIGQQQSGLVKILNGGEESFQCVRVIQIGGVVPHLFVDLCQRGSGQAVMTLAKIDQQQIRVTTIRTQLWCQCQAHILDGRKSRNDD